LKQQNGELVSNVAFNCDLRHYIKGHQHNGAMDLRGNRLVGTVPECVWWGGAG